VTDAREGSRAGVPDRRTVGHTGTVTPADEPPDTAGRPAPLPRLARDTTASTPWPVRLLSENIRAYVERMSPLWVEGQVVQLNRRGGASLAFLTLRDTDQDVSLPVSLFADVMARSPQVAEGDHVVVHARPVFWTKRGTLQLQADQLRQVGVGELLARIEHLKRVLAAEGLFDADRKRPLPFLPATVGLVCGRESKAEHDVVVNARARWPNVRFAIREVAVQGTSAVAQVSAAIAELDALPEVEVIVVARGGGAVEDLLPFSNESLVRAAAACRTPLVSAIGHETDSPLLDLVADHRASTPTDAAKRIVPDVMEERARLAQARRRLHSLVDARLLREQAGLDVLRSRPCLAAPEHLVDRAQHELDAARAALRAELRTTLDRQAGEVARLAAQVTALSPASTLARGYAVVLDAEGGVVQDAARVAPGDRVDVRLAHGSLSATVQDATAERGSSARASGG